MASSIARLQLKQSNVITTLFHNSLRLEDELARQLLSLLDGTRDRSALIQELTRLIESDSRYASGEKEAILGALTTRLEQKLIELGKLGLLVA